MGAEVGAGEAEAAAQMLHEGLCLARIVVKSNGLVQNGPVAGLAEIGGGACDEPERVIVEAGANIAVAFLVRG